MHIDLFWPDDYNEVYELLKASGWPHEAIPSRQVACESLAWTVSDDYELAGFIRVLSDTELVTYVCEIAVAEKFREHGAGRMLLDHVAGAFPNARIDLLSTQGAKAFYEATGFDARPGYRRYP